MTDVDNSDDLALLSNTPTEAEFLLHSLEQTAGRIGLYVNENKFKSFKQERSISTLSGKPLKFTDQFTNLGNKPQLKVISTYA